MARRGVVIVTINCRLGPLGFFAHPTLDKEHSEAAVNSGLLDQIAACAGCKRTSVHSEEIRTRSRSSVNPLVRKACLL